MKIAFVIWMIGWPLAIDVAYVLQAKRRAIENKPPRTDAERLSGAGISAGIWGIVGVLLFFS